MMQRSRGFTLIELLISISLFTVMLAYLSYLFYSGSNFLRSTSARSKNIEVAVFVTDSISADILRSKGISMLSNAGELILNTAGGDIIYRYSNSKIKRQEGQASSYITDDGDVENVIFDYKDGGIRVSIFTPVNTYSFIARPRDI